VRAPVRLGLFLGALAGVFGLGFLGGRLADGDAGAGAPSPTTVPVDHGGHGDGAGR
jgi:hypothetical protein